MCCSKDYIYTYIWPCNTACGILVLQPGIKPGPPALEVQSLNHWTARKSQKIYSGFSNECHIFQRTFESTPQEFDFSKKVKPQNLVLPFFKPFLPKLPSWNLLKWNSLFSNCTTSFPPTQFSEPVTGSIWSYTYWFPIFVYTHGCLFPLANYQAPLD